MDYCNFEMFSKTLVIFAVVVVVRSKPVDEVVATQTTPSVPPSTPSYDELLQLLQKLQENNKQVTAQTVPVTSAEPSTIPFEPTPQVQFTNAQQISTANQQVQSSQVSSKVQSSNQQAVSSSSSLSSNQVQSQVQAGSTVDVQQVQPNQANNVFVPDIQTAAAPQTVFQPVAVPQPDPVPTFQPVTVVLPPESVDQLSHSSPDVPLSPQQQPVASQKTFFVPSVSVNPSGEVQAVPQYIDDAQYKYGFLIDNNIEGNYIQKDEVRANGRVAGVYTYDDGFFLRSVTYVADKDGFRIIKQQVAPSTKRGRLNGNAVVKSYFNNHQYQYGIVRSDLKAGVEKKTPSTLVQYIH